MEMERAVENLLTKSIYSSCGNKIGNFGEVALPTRLDNSQTLHASKEEEYWILSAKEDGNSTLCYVTSVVVLSAAI